MGCSKFNPFSARLLVARIAVDVCIFSWLVRRIEMDETLKADGDVKSTRDVLKKWNDYYINNDFGIGIQCDKCKKWREVFQYQDRNEVPEVWICSMWEMDGGRRGSCRIPSDLKEDHFAEALYSPASLVWAKMPGYPWWPAMIEDCPDIQNYFIPYVDSEHEYHVNFFGKKPLRNWIRASRIKDFSIPPPMTPKAKKNKDLQRSIEQANEALKMRPKERLKKYSFVDRYKGRWAKVKELDKVNLPPNSLKRRRSEESADFGPQLVTEKPHANRSCYRATTVRKGRKSESKSEVGSKRKSVDDEEFQPVQRSTKPKRNGFPADPRKEMNFEKEDSSEFRPQNEADERNVNQGYRRKSTVRKERNVKPKSKATTNRKSVDEKFQPDLKSVGVLSESSSDLKEDDSEELDSSQFRSQVTAKEPHFNQGSPSTLTVWNIFNAKSKSEAATNRKSVGKEKFKSFLRSFRAINESSLDSEREENSDEQDSSLFRSQVMANTPHLNQDRTSASTVWNVRNATAKSEAATDRKKFQPFQHQIKHEGSESDSAESEEVNSEEENSSEFRSRVEGEDLHVKQEDHRTSFVKRMSEVEDLSEARSPVMAKEPHVNQDCHRASTDWKVEGKSEDAIKKKFVDNEEFQRVQQSQRHKRSICAMDSEKEESEEDSSVLNNNTTLSDNEEGESQEVNAEFVNKKYSPLSFLADRGSLSINGTDDNRSPTSSDSTIHYKHEDNFSENGSIIGHENATCVLENGTAIHDRNAAAYSQNNSGANIQEIDPSLLRTLPSCSILKNEQFSERYERRKKNRERMRKLINSNKSNYMPYSFYRGRMK